METPIPTLPGSDLHRLCVEVYLRHHDAGTGVCKQCGQRAPCLPHRHAASVLMASGEDPRWYDGQVAQPGGASGTDHATEDGGVPAESRRVQGFAVGRAPRADVPWFEYER